MTSPPPAPLSLALACPADSFWERWCRNASPDQKQHILPSAIASGVVQLHQLPVPGVQPTRNAVQALLAAMIANRPPSLEPVFANAVQAVDGMLDEDQRHAVATALGSADLSLIQGRPGSGKSRVVAEILRQAVGQKRRVLFVAPAGSALDRVIDLAGGLGPDLLRCASAGETLPPRSASLSLRERVRHFDLETLPAARRRAEDASDHLARLAPLEDAWPRLRAMPGRLEALAARRAEIERRLAALPSAVEAQWSSDPVEGLCPQWAELRLKHCKGEREIDVRLGQIADRLQAVRGETSRLVDERAPLASLVGASAGGRWWSLSYWKSHTPPDPDPRLAELDRLLAEHGAEIAALERERGDLEATRQNSRTAHAARGADLCRAEVSRREADIARELSGVTDETAALEAEWTALLPGRIDPVAVEAAEQAWRADRAAASQELARRQTLLSALQQARPGLAFDFVLGARILAAPVSELLALGADRSPGAFDLLIIDDAHRLVEKDLLALTRFAPRCVLVGEPGVPVPKPTGPPRVGPARQADASSTNVFLRSWAALHPDPVRVSTPWELRGDRLVARLRPFGPEDESQITREPVFDRPEIELAIRTPPGGAPDLVEVGFPASMCVADAKAFLYRESGELSIQAPGSCLRRREAEDAIHFLFESSPSTADVAIDLGNGVVEHIGRGGSASAAEPAWHTLGLSFARADGWDRHSAANWLAERLGLRDLGRTACLSRVYRGTPALAGFLGGLLFPRQPGSMQPPPRCDSAEFLSVPDDESKDRLPTPGGTSRPVHHPNGTGTIPLRPGRPRVGAGFEVDLGDARRIDAVGPDLRSGLPPRGIVNLPEARLVVQTLEALGADSSRVDSDGDAEPHVAVLSVFPAQVELLRLLTRQSIALARSGLRILVAHPSALAHRDCPIVCLSLTRSHSNRAVPFSDDPRDLLLALTRATERLLVFGDPGTMARRSQWFGALDHLSEAVGPVEQTLLARLLAHLPEWGTPSRPGMTLESSGV